MQSNNLYQRPWPLAALVSAPAASTGVQVYLDLCLIFLLLHVSLRIFFFLHLALVARGFSEDGAKAEREPRAEFKHPGPLGCVEAGCEITCGW